MKGIELVIAMMDEAADAAFRLSDTVVVVHDERTGLDYEVDKVLIEGGDLVIAIKAK